MLNGKYDPKYWCEFSSDIFDVFCLVCPGAPERFVDSMLQPATTSSTHDASTRPVSELERRERTDRSARS